MPDITIETCISVVLMSILVVASQEAASLRRVLGSEEEGTPPELLRYRRALATDRGGASFGSASAAAGAASANGAVQPVPGVLDIEAKVL